MIAFAHTLLAVSWEPGIRGIVVVLIAFTVLCGSTYMILSTDLGARLGMLIALAGLFGWMTLMGSIWVVYGIGLKGAEPSWKSRGTIVGTDRLAQSAVGVAPEVTKNAVPGSRVGGWLLLPEDNGGRGQAIAAADEILQVEAQSLKAGDYIPVAVYDKGGERYPNFSFNAGKFGQDNIDYLAFFHKDHYALVEVAPVIKIATEPGKAPPRAEADPKLPHWFVLMARDRGSKRQPSMFITLGSGLLFALLCRILHRRDLLVDENRNETTTAAVVKSEALETVGV